MHQPRRSRFLRPVVVPDGQGPNHVNQLQEGARVGRRGTVPPRFVLHVNDLSAHGLGRGGEVVCGVWTVLFVVAGGMVVMAAEMVVVMVVGSAAALNF